MHFEAEIAGIVGKSKDYEIWMHYLARDIFSTHLLRICKMLAPLENNLNQISLLRICDVVNSVKFFKYDDCLS